MPGTLNKGDEFDNSTKLSSTSAHSGHCVSVYAVVQPSIQLAIGRLCRLLRANIRSLVMCHTNVSSINLYRIFDFSTSTKSK